MKIGILTFHNAHNYGAVWQAFALRTVLRKMGHDAKILNYQNSKISASYVAKLKTPKCKLSILHPGSFLIRLNKHLDTWYAQSAWEKQCKVFENFIENVLLEGDRARYSQEDIGMLQEDAYICGSDQIWTEWLTGGADGIYVLDFATEAKKIAYGASRFSAEFSLEQNKYFREKLKDFAGISVREKSLANALTDICEREVETVLDPTLLLRCSDYENMESAIPEKGNFVLAYFLSEDDKLSKCAERAADFWGISLIEIHYYKQRGRKNRQIADCAPEEFLSYIHRAKCVFTNSFHGTVFSIIYQKDFWVVYDADNRKTALLEMTGLEKRHINGVEDFKPDDKIAYGPVEIKLDLEREKSLMFLKKSLE